MLQETISYLLRARLESLQKFHLKHVRLKSGITIARIVLRERRMMSFRKATFGQVQITFAIYASWANDWDRLKVLWMLFA